MAFPTPDQAASKWQSRTKQAVPEYRLGVEGVQESPMDKAADQAEKDLNRIQEAVSSGKYQARLRAVPLSEWKNKTVNIGAPRISAGVDGAVSDVEAFYRELFPFEENLKSKIDDMDDSTLQDSIARMVAWTEGMAGFKRGV